MEFGGHTQPHELHVAVFRKGLDHQLGEIGHGKGTYSPGACRWLGTTSPGLRRFL
jgi:hypothetical protein